MLFRSTQDLHFVVRRDEAGSYQRVDRHLRQVFPERWTVKKGFLSFMQYSTWTNSSHFSLNGTGWPLPVCPQRILLHQAPLSSAPASSSVWARNTGLFILLPLEEPELFYRNVFYAYFTCRLQIADGHVNVCPSRKIILPKYRHLYDGK